MKDETLLPDAELITRLQKIWWVSGCSHCMSNDTASKIIAACRAAMLQGADGNSPVIPDGWKLVPVEPTEDMLRAAYRESGVYSAKAYRAMLAAAPEGGNDHDTRR
ncbi:hypothetical protein ACUNFK_22600 [Serratia sp. IR-2025]